MQPHHNNQNNSVPIYLDYDLIALSNTLTYSFEEGLHLASSMLNAPFAIINHYGYVIIHSSTPNVDDEVWNRIIETRFCPPSVLENSHTVHSVLIPDLGQMLYYSLYEPTNRQAHLANYIAWMISLFGDEKFQISDSNSSPKSQFLLYLINNRFNQDDFANEYWLNELPKQMQLLACFCNSQTDTYSIEISKICRYTEYIAIYKQKYRLFLFPTLTLEQTDALSDLFSQNNIYGGLSYPFENPAECSKHLHQAIAALKEAARHEHGNKLEYYENIFAMDILYHYHSDTPLTTFRHPIFQILKEYDLDHNSELYITLITYLENSGDTKKTAVQLSMHRNTVLYRLRQIEEITEYSIQNPDCRSSLLYAVSIERFLKRHDK